MEVFLGLLISGLALGAVYSMIGIGYSLIYKASGLMTFVQGDILTLGAFLGLTFNTMLRLPYWLSLILTVVVVFLIGFLIEKGIIRRLLNKDVNLIYIVLSTIALSYVIQNGAQAIWGGTYLYFPSVFSVTTVEILGVAVQPEVILCFVMALVGMICLYIFMNKTKNGTAMRAASMDRMAAEACGINVSWTTGLTWGIAAGLAAAGGMLVGPIYSVYITLGASLGKKAYAGAVIGGYGNMYGAMVGGLLLGLFETFAAGYISSEYKNLMAYILLILFLFIRPTGIFNERAIQDE